MEHRGAPKRLQSHIEDCRVSLLEDVKPVTGKATGWKRPDDPQAFFRERKPQSESSTEQATLP
jgi:hypothetical protein